ncbi:probable mitochondrial saccharopine dehydrogenase-like oxidoreductase At5g39410 [Selaginella moellendorffii]|uniref:probable mitochondrial saccharopine dehydrogenase-like oxidoreductase At5g39410 n=1 Tax=Selaginella moellendorffii TaxID=88036 RepID=UPI000D1C7C10|nr:probable mitochondrial saccharopine dehydrogenase-like oxidoreductase At5g39410 [Selaginella moellendorffii]|eukprot:XP_024536476.1 probable mitochondrial saccharopine dehydrogenase-like oxidoreductase At5g39410 [Selaginella moellendorffii]
MKVGIAGCSRQKMEESLSWALGHTSEEQRLKLYGEPFVAACAESGIDYLDITGEPEFMERMRAKYHEQAVDRKSLVVSSCGFDSVPAEFGIPGVPLKRPAVHWEDAVNSWAVKIPSSDAVLVRRTLATVAENPDGLPTASKHQEQSLKQWTDIKPKAPAQPSGGFHRGSFQQDGPSQEEIDNSSFSMVFVGRGFKDASKVPPGKKQQPDTEIITRVTGPEIGYVTTPIILVQAVLLVLKNRDKLPKGGVWTPGVAFGTAKQWLVV